MNVFGTAELKAEQEEQLFARIMKFVGERKLEMPAIFLLELFKPLSFLASQAVVLASPLLVAVLGLQRAGELYWLLEDRGRLEHLIQRLETGAGDEVQAKDQDT